MNESMHDDKGINGAESELRNNLRYYGTLGEAGLSERIKDLDQEFDGEAVIATALATAGVGGLLMGALGSRLWRGLVWASLPTLFVVSRKDWRAPESVLRFLGLRSRFDIQEEKYALKALRGDFKRVDIPLDAVGEALERSSTSALQAVKA
jgi:hypothetical protein